MSDTILGAIVGALSAIGGSVISGIIAQIIRTRLEFSRQDRDLLLKGIEDAKKLVYFASTSSEPPPDELVTSAKTKLTLFASDELIECFETILDNANTHTITDAQIDRFNALIKKELGIKTGKRRKKTAQKQ